MSCTGDRARHFDLIRVLALQTGICMTPDLMNFKDSFDAVACYVALTFLDR